jgi:stress response protein YsnF
LLPAHIHFSQEQFNMQTVLGAFDDMAAAQRAVERLVEAGFDRQDVHVHQETSMVDDEKTRRGGAEVEREVAVDRRGFFARLFGDDDRSNYASTYSEAARRGSSVVVVDATDEAQADRAASVLHELGAIDVDERAQQWRAGGRSDDGSTANEARDGQDKVLDVVQEELQVGKRRLDRGGVRVVERVSQQPVREIVNLREERAVVDRRAVDRPATDADLSGMREGTLEVRETVEEPVVSKTARVVEEVRVGKEVRERQETVEDSVRRKDVDIQRVEGDSERRIPERDRALASEREADTQLGQRDRDAGASLTGTRKTRKDKPSDV